MYAVRYKRAGAVEPRPLLLTLIACRQHAQAKDDYHEKREQKAQYRPQPSLPITALGEFVAQDCGDDANGQHKKFKPAHSEHCYPPFVLSITARFCPCNNMACRKMPPWEKYPSQIPFFPWHTTSSPWELSRRLSCPADEWIACKARGGFCTIAVYDGQIVRHGPQSPPDARKQSSHSKCRAMVFIA